MKKNSGSLMFKYRSLVWIVCMCPVGVMVVFSSPLVMEDSFIDSIMGALGWLYFILYITFRIWATLYLGGRKDKELQTQGPYSITRNPLYFGNFCFALSTAFFFNSISLLIAALIVIVIHSHFVIRAEEQILESIFEDLFRDHVQKTPRLLPRFYLHHTSNSVEVNLKVLKAEAKRLWPASLMPFFSEILMHIRTAAWWPHWFTLY